MLLFSPKGREKRSEWHFDLKARERVDHAEQGKQGALNVSSTVTELRASRHADLPSRAPLLGGYNHPLEQVLRWPRHRSTRYLA